MNSNGYQCYHSKRIRKALSVILLFTQTFTAFPSIPRMATENRQVFIQRIGKLNAVNQAVYPQLEKQIQRWLENMDGLQISTISKNASLKADTLEMELVSMEIKHLISELQKKIFVGSELDGARALVDKMVEKRKQLSGVAIFGPRIQESLVFEAAYYWKISKKEKAKELLHRALMIHPQGLVKELTDWEYSASSEFNWVGFDSLIAQERKLVKRGCTLQVEVQPPKAQFNINGFQVNAIEPILLPVGAIHHLSVGANGYSSVEELVRCQGVGKRMVRIKLVERNSVDKGQARQPTLLVRVIRDEFKLYLYTPNLGVDEIPLTKPIRVAELVEDNEDYPISVTNDAVLDIFQRHNIASLDNRDLGRVDIEGKNTPLMTLDANVQGKSRDGVWYKSPVFWGIIGGLIAGGAVTYFTTRSSGDVNSSEMDPGAMAR